MHVTTPVVAEVVLGAHGVHGPYLEDCFATVEAQMGASYPRPRPPPGIDWFLLSRRGHRPVQLTPGGAVAPCGGAHFDDLGRPAGVVRSRWPPS